MSRDATKRRPVLERLTSVARSDIARSSAVRAISLVGTTASSAVLISSLSARDLGFYFTLFTVGYIANAAFGVGLDQRLQQAYLPLLRDRAFPSCHFFRASGGYVAAAAVVAAAAMPWVGVGTATVLLGLTASTFLLTTSRAFNMMRDEQSTLNAMVLVEGLGKPILLIACLALPVDEPFLAAIAAYAMTQAAAAMLGLVRLTRRT